jgi:hypothetical protein
MEDSAGTTHLFYREYVNRDKDCLDNTSGRQVYDSENSVNHLNVSSQEDSVLFKNYYLEACFAGAYDSKTIFSYTFDNANPEKWVISGMYDYFISISDYNNVSIGYPVAIPTKIANKSSGISYMPQGLVLSPNSDSLYIKTYSTLTIPLSGNSKDWPIIKEDFEFTNYADSVAIEWNIIDIHPEIDSLYFAINSSGDLYRSTKYSGDFTFADSSTYFRHLFFDADNTHIYSPSSSGLLRSDELGAKDSWELLDIDFQTNSSKFLSVDESISGNIFLSDSSDVLFSNDYGDNFTVLLSVEDKVSGLYKKPDSNLLYVLTRKELLEVNTDTKEATTLKTLPVSNEPEQNEIPKQVSLQQNYPNPFNPSTVISYQLTGNRLVNLEVFNVTGRKVAVLVNDEQKSAGTHQVTFNAGNLSSGVYLYRLETTGQVLTKKMLLLK